MRERENINTEDDSFPVKLFFSQYTENLYPVKEYTAVSKKWKGTWRMCTGKKSLIVAVYQATPCFLVSLRRIWESYGVWVEVC